MAAAGVLGMIMVVLAEVLYGSRITATRRAGWFTASAQVNQRRYEALRAFFVDGLSYATAGER